MANVVVFTTGTNLHGDIYNLAVISEDKALRSGDDNVVYIIPLRKTNNRNTNIQTTEAWSFELSLIELREIGRKATMINQLGVDARRQLSKFWGSFIETNPDFQTVQRHYSNHFIKLSTRLTLRFFILECDPHGYQLRVELRAGFENEFNHLRCDLTIGELLNIVERNAQLVGTLEDWSDELTTVLQGEDWAGIENPLNRDDGDWVASFRHLHLDQN